uniref:NADH-ubiquinone oxidoreductase chain 1 n=1 Tax=Spondylus violaceus TaxID=1163653 RepID=A0A515MNP6_9BIVA|nr:NADH dehydrogenase subunit 1 [Spondylus violaceus]
MWFFVWGVSMYVSVLLGVAYFTLFERKLIAICQKRKGPSLVGWLGLMQPFADGLKLFCKEFIIPYESDKFLFFFAPSYMMIHMFLLWSCGPSVWNCSVYFVWGALYFLSVLSVGVYGVVMAGWSSNSKYSLFGTVRALAQVISYEVLLITIFMFPLFLGGSLNLQEVGEVGLLTARFCWVGYFSLVGWLFCVLAETNRAPFDLVEGESELVSGFNVEYSGPGFAMIFIAEYGNVIFLGTVTVAVFWGGSMMGVGSCLVEMGLVGVFLSFVVLCRCSMPRFRYDMLMKMAWVSWLPLVLMAFGWFVLVLGA